VGFLATPQLIAVSVLAGMSVGLDCYQGVEKHMAFIVITWLVGEQGSEILKLTLLQKYVLTEFQCSFPQWFHDNAWIFF
jgi:hypothetical protein